MVNLEWVVAVRVFVIDVGRRLDCERVRGTHFRPLAELRVFDPERDELRRRNDDEVSRVVVAIRSGALARRARNRRRLERHLDARVWDGERRLDCDRLRLVERLGRAIPLERCHENGNLGLTVDEDETLLLIARGGVGCFVRLVERGESRRRPNRRRLKDWHGLDARLNGRPRRLDIKRDERAGRREVERDGQKRKVGIARRTVTDARDETLARDDTIAIDEAEGDVFLPARVEAPCHDLLGRGK